MIKYSYKIGDTTTETLDINSIPNGLEYETIEFEINQPIIEIPQEVQLWRVRTILKLSGLESNIETALNGLDEPMKTGALYVWNYGTTIERGSATVQLLQYVLGLTDTQVDDIFIQANAIQI